MKLVALVLFAAGCAPLPADPAQRGLYGDLRKVVTIAESSDWVVDRIEIEDALPLAMESVCRADDAARLGALRFIDARIAEEGGPSRERYLRNGHQLAPVRETLRLERIRAVLDRAIDRSDEDCPYYLEPDRDFRGVQGDEDRFVLWLESLGGFGLVIRGSSVELGGGGGARVLGGFGLGARATLMMGVEVGAIASFPETDAGARQLQATFGGALPVVLRLRDSIRVIDFEIAPTVRYVDGELSLPPGIRGAIGVGLSSTRVGGFMPHALLWIGYEYRPVDGGQPEHGIRIGTRVGLDWDP